MAVPEKFQIISYTFIECFLRAGSLHIFVSSSLGNVYEVKSICYDFDVLKKSVKPLIEDGAIRVLLRSYDQLGIMNVYFLGKADFEQVEIVNAVPRFGFADRSQERFLRHSEVQGETVCKAGGW